MVQASVPGWAGHQDVPASVRTVSIRIKKPARNASSARLFSRTHARSLMSFRLSHRAPAASAGNTNGPAGPYESCMPPPAGHPFAGAGPYSLPCRAAPAAACNGDMHTEPQTMQAPRLGRYEIDASRSRVTFRTRHMFGLGPVRGTFAIRSGSVDIAEPLADSAVQAEIDAASFRTGNEQRDQSVLSARLLDATRYPVMSFRDGLVSADGTTIQGTLTVREVARPVSLSIGQVTADERSFTASGTVRVDGTEFGVTAMRGLAGRYLDLTVEVQCVRR